MNASTSQRAAASTRVLALLTAVGLAGGLLSFGITEEIPLGGLTGKVTLKENGKAIEGVEVNISPSEVNKNEAARRRTLVTDREGRFSLRTLPAGDYTIFAYAKAHRLDEQRITIKEGEPTALELAMNPDDPYLNINTSQKVFLPEEEPSFQADGFLANENLKIDVFKLNLAEVVKKGSVRDLLEAFSRYATTPQDPAKFGQKVRSLEHPITKRDAEGVFVEAVALDPLAEGFYWIRCRSGKVDRGAYLNVSKIGMVTKSGEKQTMCYVADLQSGQPIDKAAIGLAVDSGLKQVGMTNQEGTLNVTRSPNDHQLLVARKDNSVAVVDFYVRSDESSNSKGRVFLYSDRPVYRPGDKVEFKGIARLLNGADFKVPTEGKVNCEVRDADDNLVESFQADMTTRGTFFGSFTSNKEAKPGVYALIAKGPGGEGRLDIRIAAYRKPEFKITVTPLEKFYVFGQQAKMRIKCEYYHGGPVVGAKIDAYVTRSPRWTWEGEDGEEYADESGSGEGVEDFEAVSDSKGEAIIEFDTKKPEEKSYGSETDYTYSVMVSASDEGDKYFEGAGSVKVTRGRFQTEIETNDYLGEVGRPVELTVKATSHEDGKGIAGKTIQIVAGEDNWTGEKVDFEPMENLQATTGPDGTAKLSYTPSKPGSLVFKAIAVDELKNEIESSAYFYVEGSGVPARPGGKLTVTLDKRKYDVGDTVKTLIQTDKPGGFALLTVEGDEVLYQKVVNLTQSVTIVSMQVAKAFAPNAQVSIAYMREKQFYEASESLVLNLANQKLQVSISPDKEKVLPGQAVTYTISTKDMAGKPVSADLSLGVVDESIYAIRADDTDPFGGFFPRRSISVQTSYSFPEIYLDGGDKGAGNVPIRSKFMDTAFWDPKVQTDATGEARVTVTLPDNLTTWRATVLAATDQTAVGIATKTVVASKPLMIKLQTPQYMVVQDQQKISAIVQNDTGQAADIRVGITVKGLDIDGKTSQNIRVEPGVPTTVEWTATAQSSGVAEITATAEISGGGNDGVKGTFEVKPHGREFQEIQAGMAKGETNFDVTVREGADRNTGRLVLRLSPSIATSLVQSLDGLVQFPYGCVEQTMSRFLPAILVDQALAETGLARPDLRAKVPAIAADGLARLAKMQHGDGGWGWWEYDDSDPFMTALVLDGLQRAKAAGFKVNESMLNRSLEWAEKRFTSEKGKTDLRRDRVYLCYALAANGKVDAAKKAFAFDFKDAGAPDLALGALTANLIGNAELKTQLLGQLKSKAKVTPQTASWAQEQYSWGQESTALALGALVKLDPTSELVGKTIRYLMQARRGEYWFSTRDTSYVLIGMTAYLRQTKELENLGGTFTISVNGKEVKSITFDKNSLFHPDLQVTIPMSELQVGKNSVKIAQNGQSVCYYAADLKQVIPDSQLGTLVGNNDLKIERAYYKMEARRMEDGTMKFEASDKPVDKVESGDIIKVVLTVKWTKDREFVLLEDPIPSNCRVTERDEVYDDEQWGWWWARTIIMDDRVAFFARKLEKGNEEFSYIMRAESAGKSNALPSRIGNMYDPEDYASNQERSLEVEPR
ncbi:MAG: carboxypeptidase regulatory-like domain-containing protein [Chlorobia bacterium]|nr:carboxypeptidase regulatory-like domain-containing protein [Fimbriimonadaceae bacterium]